MAEDLIPKERRGCARLLAAGAMVALGLGAIGVALLYTGQPQRLGAQYLLSSQLGGRAQVASLSLRNPLVLQGLTLADQAASLYGPALSVDRTAVQYDWRPDNGRYLHDVAISGVRLSLRQGAEGSNFQFLMDQFGQPGGGAATDPTPWLPERLGLDDLWLELDFPSYYFRMDKIGLEAALGGATEGTLSGTGTVSVDTAWDGAGAEIDAVVDLGPLARIRVAVSYQEREGEPFLAISIPEATLEDPLWSAILTDLSPIPVRFDTLAVAESDIHVHRDEGHVVVDQATIDLQIPRLSVGAEEAPYYAGPLAIAVRGNYGTETSINGTLRLLEGATISGDLQWTPERATGTFTTDPWPRAVLVALTPKAYGPLLALFRPLETLQAHGTVVQEPDGFQVKGTLAGAIGAVPVEVPLTLAYQRRDADPVLTVHADVALHDGTVQADVTVPAAGAPKTALALNAVQPQRWVETLLGNPVSSSFQGALSGAVNVETPAGEAVEVVLDLTGEGVGYHDLLLPSEPPLSISGSLAYNPGTGTLSGVDLRLHQDDALDLRSQGWTFDPGKINLKAPVEGTLLLAALGLGDAYGSVALSTGIVAGADQIQLNEARFSSEDLGYGDWSVPYGLTLRVSGNLTYNFAASGLEVAALNASLGDGTRLSADTLALQLPGAAAFGLRAAPFYFHTDFDVFVRRGLLGEGTTGTASVRSEDFSWKGETYTGVISWEIAADHLALPDKMATLESVAWNGRFNPGDDQDGGGPLTASAVSIYEIPFGAVDTHLRITPAHLTCDTLETTFLGGNLRMNGRVDYHDPAFPAQVDLEVSGLDLAEFTKVFEPPDVVLTGKVSGTADVALSTEGLQDLHVDLTAYENLTLNRDMVRQILMSQYVNDAVGSKSVQKVIEKVIGKDDQRPFEKAILQLRLEDGLIKGEARMESKSLDVTVDINAEPAAILQAIQSAAEQD
jgi:hypothetical protein